MVAFIRVVDSPYAVKTDSAGLAVLHNVPDGAATVRVWHPYMTAKDNEVSRAVQISASSQLVFDVEMHAAPDRSGY